MIYNAVYFIELNNGIKYYKTDSFWSKNPEAKYAKLHTDEDSKKFLESYLYTLQWILENEKKDGGFEEYRIKNINSLYGYQIFDPDQIDSKNNFILKENPVLSQPFYISIISDIKEDGTVIIEDYKKIIREEKLNI